MVLAWSIVGEQQECEGREIGKGKMDSIDDCAKACREHASMFVFGTNDFGVDRCDLTGCNCLCETGARSDGTCDTADHRGYRLYKFSTSGNIHV